MTTGLEEGEKSRKCQKCLIKLVVGNRIPSGFRGKIDPQMAGIFSWLPLRIQEYQQNPAMKLRKIDLFLLSKGPFSRFRNASFRDMGVFLGFEGLSWGLKLNIIGKPPGTDLLSSSHSFQRYPRVGRALPTALSFGRRDPSQARTCCLPTAPYTHP